MVRFKTRWLLLAIDDKPLATTSPFASKLADEARASMSTSASTLASAQQAHAIDTSSTLTPQLITRLLRASLLYNFGDVAAGAFGGVLTCKYYSSHTGTAIVRCSRDAARLVWAAATLISSPVEAEVGASCSSKKAGPSLRMRVIHCGGTIKKVQNKAIELDRKLILRVRAKQAKIAPSSSRTQVLTKAVTPAASLADEIAKPAVVPIAPLDDDEDLGEALDPGKPVVDLTTPTSSTRAEVPAKKSPKPLNDPETQALLAQSRKEISSITM